MRHSARLFRSAADATRFTATSPHAYSAPTPIRRAAAGTFSPSHAPSSNPEPRAANLNPSASQDAQPSAPPPPPRPTETPAQKVARLRAARLAEKAAQVSTWDRVVVTGREWADRIHRTVTLGLIAFTGISPPFSYSFYRLSLLFFHNSSSLPMQRIFNDCSDSITDRSYKQSSPVV